MPSTKSSTALAADFDRIAALPEGGGWDHNSHYHAYLLRHLPVRFGSALDIGCGKGEFARLLGQRADQVTGIDLSPRMIEIARERSSDPFKFRFEVANVMALNYPPASFDCIASIATLHHLPLDLVLAHIKGWLKPGGVLLVCDLVATEPQWLWMDGLSLLLNPLYKWRYGSGKSSEESAAAWHEHGSAETYPTLSEVKQVCRDLLPGAKARHHLFWRYTLVWQAP